MAGIVFQISREKLVWLGLDGWSDNDCRPVFGVVVGIPSGTSFLWRLIQVTERQTGKYVHHFRSGRRAQEIWDQGV